MRISKHIHSCLTVEAEGKRILIDPGNYTFDEGVLDVGKLENLSIFGNLPAGKVGLTHPGDSLKFDKSLDVLALPIQASWVSMVASVEKAAQVKPKIVIPIHDWHWKDSARKKMYDMAKNYLAEKGVELRGLEIGEELEI